MSRRRCSGILLMLILTVLAGCSYGTRKSSGEPNGKMVEVDLNTNTVSEIEDTVSTEEGQDISDEESLSEADLVPEDASSPDNTGFDINSLLVGEEKRELTVIADFTDEQPVFEQYIRDNYPEFFPDLRYVITDINGDGVPEAFVETMEVTDVLTCLNGEVVWVAGFDVMPGFIPEKGIVVSSCGDGETTYIDLYELNESGTALELVTGVEVNGARYFKSTQDASLEFSPELEITEEEYTTFRSKVEEATQRIAEEDFMQMG